jgi:hypothetical protein
MSSVSLNTSARRGAVVQRKGEKPGHEEMWEIAGDAAEVKYLPEFCRIPKMPDS